MTTKKKPVAKKAAKKVIAKKRSANKAAVAVKPLSSARKKQLAEQKLRREINRRNKLFAAADNAGKRVLIAKDVIEQLKLRRFKAQPGTWVNFGTALHEKWDEAQHINEHGTSALNVLSENVREKFLAKKMPSCSCCALGSMFMSCTLLNNQTTVHQLNIASSDLGDAIESPKSYEDDGVFSNGLIKFFSAAQLKLIEHAFEGEGGYFYEWPYDDGGQPVKRSASKMAAMRWRDKYPDAKKRLIAIMQNIIDNNGTFKP